MVTAIVGFYASLSNCVTDMSVVVLTWVRDAVKREN